MQQEYYDRFERASRTLSSVCWWDTIEVSSVTEGLDAPVVVLYVNGQDCGNIRVPSREWDFVQAFNA